jgi:hypothetical protein
MSNLPTIPDFTDDAASIGTALRAMKQVVEIIAGQRQGPSFGAPQVFVQELEPVTSRVTSFKTGDLWVNILTTKLFYWDGRLWQQL